MPNWCENRLEIFFSTKKEKEYVLELIKNFEKGTLLNFIKPMPKHQPNLKKPNPFFAEGGLDSRNNGFGENNWYDWSVKNWGTKWDVQYREHVLRTDSVILNFESAWSPPVQAFSNFKLSFKLEYVETGAGYYGIAQNFDGELEDVSSRIDFKAERYDDEDSIREAMLDMALEDGIETSIIDNLNMPSMYYNPDWLEEQGEEDIEN